MASNPTPQQIRDARRNAGHTQAEAADFMKCARRTWQDWERRVSPMPINTWELYLIKTGQAEPEAVDYEKLVPAISFSADQISKAVYRSAVSATLKNLSDLLDDRNLIPSHGEISITKTGDVFTITSNLQMVPK